MEKADNTINKKKNLETNEKESRFTAEKKPDQIRTYFLQEKLPVLLVTITGLFYNVGLVAGPWFEGKLAERLMEILQRKKTWKDMLFLALFYVICITAVQIARYYKRFYVRRFANNVSRSMKGVLYRNLVHKKKPELQKENVGSLMTKAISDVDACAEGMRKFTTEVFDTGIALLAYLAMLFLYDWKLALLSCSILPFAYLIANKLKKPVSKSAAEWKECTGKLNGETLERVKGALTYRVLGQEKGRDDAYELRLGDYLKKAVRAGMYETAIPPLYQAFSMLGIIAILVIGGRYVIGGEKSGFGIAAFTTFLACYRKLAVKSSKAAKLFNSVQKAKVSWKRIKPLMTLVPQDDACQVQNPAELTVSGLSFSYEGQEILHNISFQAKPGQIIGVTGSVACGKSTLGKVFLCEQPYRGSILFNKKELQEQKPSERCGIVSYLGHEVELMSDSIKQNILLYGDGNAKPYEDAVCLTKEIERMPEGDDTRIMDGGVRLSGGQQARVALARALYHEKPLLILDDPFSALDRTTETEVFKNLQRMSGDKIVILISHRLYLFPELSKVLWMENGTVEESTHEELMQTKPEYRSMYETQCATGIESEQSEAAEQNQTAQSKTPETENTKQNRSAAQVSLEQKKAGKKWKPNSIGGRQGAMVLTGLLLLFFVLMSVFFVLLPPLLLEKMINGLTGGEGIPLSEALFYYVTVALSGGFDAGKELFITVFGQKLTYRLRRYMCEKLRRLPAAYFTGHEPGVVTSLFVGDVDTLETLFSSGVIGMFADACKIFGILAVIFVKSKGLGILLLLVLFPLFIFTRAIQRKMLKAQKQNREIIGKQSSFLPETIKNIRMLHVFRKEEAMELRYQKLLQESYLAVDRVNFCDAVYSPVILCVSAVLVAVMMVLSATGGEMQSLFGMSVGTAVAVIAYVSKVFGPLESIGMEIQTVQSAVAGVQRIKAFLRETERKQLPEGAAEAFQLKIEEKPQETVRFQEVDFSYEDRIPVLRKVSFRVQVGESVTLAGRTGAGKSTVFKLLLGFYSPDAGTAEVYLTQCEDIPDECKRRLFGYVEQNFRAVPGTVLEQIRVFDGTITREDVEKAAELAGIREAMEALPNGMETEYSEKLFSKGQTQLLAIARAIAANPRILLLDEITANLDTETEEKVLSALIKAGENRTVLSISHRLYEHNGGRMIHL